MIDKDSGAYFWFNTRDESSQWVEYTHPNDDAPAAEAAAATEGTTTATRPPAAGEAAVSDDISTTAAAAAAATAAPSGAGSVTVDSTPRSNHPLVTSLVLGALSRMNSGIGAVVPKVQIDSTPIDFRGILEDSHEAESTSTKSVKGLSVEGRIQPPTGYSVKKTMQAIEAVLDSEVQRLSTKMPTSSNLINKMEETGLSAMAEALADPSKSFVKRELPASASHDALVADSLQEMAAETVLHNALHSARNSPRGASPRAGSSLSPRK